MNGSPVGFWKFEIQSIAEIQIRPYCRSDSSSTTFEAPLLEQAVPVDWLLGERPGQDPHETYGKGNRRGEEGLKHRNFYRLSSYFAIGPTFRSTASGLLFFPLTLMGAPNELA